MNAEQFRALPSWVSKRELCRLAGLSPNAIRMRVERGGELTEGEQEALDIATDTLTRTRVVKDLVRAVDRLISSAAAYDGCSAESEAEWLDARADIATALERALGKVDEQ